MRTLIAATLAACLVSAAASAATVPELFGSRVTPFHTNKPVAADLDGDGTPDTVYLVTIAAGSAKSTFAKDVTLVGDQLLSKPLGNNAENAAIAIVLGKSGKKFVITGYRGDEYEDYFDTVVWNEKAAPLRVVAHGSPEFAKCTARYKEIKFDYLSLGTSFDYEDILYWNGKMFRSAAWSPQRKPCTR